MKYEKFEEIKTQRLILRKINYDDAECYYKRLSSNEDVARYMLWMPHQSQQQTHASIEKVIFKYESGACYTWGIALQDDNSIIGRIDLLRIDEEKASCSFAYMLGKEFWGLGYGTEALKAVFNFAFEKLEIKSIIADHISENIASGKAMQKAGMELVGSYASKYEKCGKSYDVDEYMITFDQWDHISKEKLNVETNN